MIKVRIEYCVLWLILIVLFIYNDIFLERKKLKIIFNKVSNVIFDIKWS